MNNHDLYDISTYTDSQLYDILDLNNPSDRELEAKILANMDLYEANETKLGKRLYQYFQDIYDHFFETDNAEEGFQIQGEKPSLNMAGETIKFTGNVMTGNTVSTNIVMGTVSPDYPTLAPNYTSPPENINPIQNEKNIQEILPANYAQDPTGINPLLNKTIQRIICVDSQFRNKKYQPVSTNYTFNLSEPLTNVVSLSLYSVNIPYTWYTIRRGYGSNFYYYKGSSPGITNGSHDYKVSIAPGNYGPADLQNAIHNSILKLPNTYTDANFGETDILYSSLDSLIRFKTDIQKVYNECYYKLEFTDISMANFLGFNNSILNMNTIIGSNFIDPRQSITSDNQYTYTFNSTNNYFIVHRYTNQSSFEYNSNSNIMDISFIVQIPIPSANDLTNNANNIYNNINIALQQGPFIESKIAFIPDANSIGHYEMKIVLDRTKLYLMNQPTHMPNEKIAIEFPNDPLWLDININTNINQRLFNFKNKFNNMSIFMADNSYPVNSIRLDGNSNVLFKCTRKYYDTGNNDFSFNIPAGIYDTRQIPSTLNQIFLKNPLFQTQKLLYNNTAYSRGTNVTFDASDNVVMNMYILKQFDDYIIKITDPLSVLHTAFDMSLNYEYNTKTTYSNIKSHTDPSIVFNTNYICTFYPNKSKSINNSGNWNDISYNVYLTNLSGTFDSSYNLYIYSSFDTLISDIIISFEDNLNQIGQTGATNITNIKDQLYDYHFIFNNTLFNSNYDIIKGIVTFTYNFSIINILTQADYIAEFKYDGSYNNIPADPTKYGKNSADSVNLWAFIGIKDNVNSDLYIGNQDISGIYHYDLSINLYANIFDVSYVTINRIDVSFIDQTNTDVSNQIVVIKGTHPMLLPSKYKPLINSTIKISSNMITDLSGVLSEFTNQFTINIPTQDYTLNSLYFEINKLLNPTLTKTSYSSTNGSSINYKLIDGKDYTTIFMNVNIIYTSKDYNLVLFDNVSFSTCSYGEASILNAKIDNSLGWILGYRNFSILKMLKSNQIYNLADEHYYYLSPTNSYFDYSGTNDSQCLLEVKTIIELSGDTTVTCSAIYNYFLIVLDDYIQNHLNDGLVTVTKPENKLNTPSYSHRAEYVLDPVTNKCTAISKTNSTENRLTQKQLYSLNTVANQINPNADYSDSPYVQDIFGIVPIKSGTNGQYYVEFGGTLQSQQRKYFGPVNIHRMSIQLVDDKGHIVDLNNSEWTFSLVCEQLYMQPSPTK